MRKGDSTWHICSGTMKINSNTVARGCTGVAISLLSEKAQKEKKKRVKCGGKSNLVTKEFFLFLLFFIYKGSKENFSAKTPYIYSSLLWPLNQIKSNNFTLI